MKRSNRHRIRAKAICLLRMQATLSKVREKKQMQAGLRHGLMCQSRSRITQRQERLWALAAIDLKAIQRILSHKTRARVLQNIQGILKQHWSETSSQRFWIRLPTRFSSKMLTWVKSVLQGYLSATVMAMIPLHSQVSVSTQEIHIKNSPRATTMVINTCSHLLKTIRLNSQTLVCLIKQALRPNISHLNLFQWYKIQVIEKATSQKSKQGATQSVEMVTLQSLLVTNNESHRTKRKSWIRAKTCLLTTDSEQLAQLTKKEKALCNQIPLTTEHRPQNIVARLSTTTRVISHLECQAKTFKTNFKAHKLSRTWTHGDQAARYQTKRRVIRGKDEPIACSYRFKTIDRCSNPLLITATRWPMVKCSIQALTTPQTLNQTTTNESSRPSLTYWIRQRV